MNFYIGAKTKGGNTVTFYVEYGKCILALMKSVKMFYQYVYYLFLSVLCP